MWGTHLRWASLCRKAWEIVFDQRIPLTTTTPPIVNYGRKLHDEILEVVSDFFERYGKAPLVKRDYEVRFFVEPPQSGMRYEIVAKPDLYVLLDTGENYYVNCIVEVTTRSRSTTPIEWLIAQMIGTYIANLRPASAILVTPSEVSAITLSTAKLKKFERILSGPPNRKIESWMCSNCDLLPVCDGFT